MMKITTLDKRVHERKGFDCGEPALNHYLKRISSQHDIKGLSKTFVLTSEDEPTRIQGYYSLGVCKVLLNELPEALARKYPTELYCALIGRLAVHKSQQGKGLGTVLLMDAIKKAVTSGVATPMIIIDAKTERLSELYQSYGFTSFSGQRKRLYISTKDAKANLIEAGIPLD